MEKTLNLNTTTTNLKFLLQLDTFGLPDESYSISDIQDYFEYIIKNMKLLLITLLYKFMLIK